MSFAKKYGLIILVPLVGFGFNAQKTAAQGQRALEFVPLVIEGTVLTQPYFGAYAVGHLVRFLQSGFKTGKRILPCRTVVSPCCQRVNVDNAARLLQGYAVYFSIEPVFARYLVLHRGRKIACRFSAGLLNIVHRYPSSCGKARYQVRCIRPARQQRIDNARVRADKGSDILCQRRVILL